LLQALHGHHGYVHHAVFSPDGQTVLTCSADKTARLWNIERGGFLRVFRGHGATVNTAVFSADETRVLTASYDETARLWDAASGAPGVQGTYQLRHVGRDQSGHAAHPHRVARSHGPGVGYGKRQADQGAAGT
jgi:WD40 repeat protein